MCSPFIWVTTLVCYCVLSCFSFYISEHHHMFFMMSNVWFTFKDEIKHKETRHHKLDICFSLRAILVIMFIMVTVTWCVKPETEELAWEEEGRRSTDGRTTTADLPYNIRGRARGGREGGTESCCTHTTPHSQYIYCIWTFYTLMGPGVLDCLTSI